MNNTITPNTQPLYTFQNRAGDFVDVLARAEYQGEQVDVTCSTKNGRTSYVVEGTKTTTARFDNIGQAFEAFASQRLVRLAQKFGTYEVAK